MAQHSLINTTFPVLLPEMPELRLDRHEFDETIKSLLPPKTGTSRLPVRNKLEHSTTTATESNTMSEAAAPQVTQTRNGSTTSSTTNSGQASSEATKVTPGLTYASVAKTDSPFMTGLLADRATVPSFDSRDGKMLTENADVAHSTSGQALVDLFFELEDVVSAERLGNILQKAWAVDEEATLKIIWNARSIHLGKSSRATFYRAVGWLAQNHPLTLITNLPWLVRPLIEKKPAKKNEKKGGELPKDAEMVDSKDADSDFEIIDEEGEEVTQESPAKKLKLDEDAELAQWDVKHGGAHGFWKDLPNILALAANDQLKVDGKPREVLNVPKPSGKPYKRDWTEGHKKTVNSERHDRAVEKVKSDPFYKALHLQITRLFVDQLTTDLARLKSGKKSEMKLISLAAKWAPTHKGMHDQHTCIVSSIAELLHPFDKVCPEGVDPADRELYLKHARIAYQSQTLSPLRKHLEVVERNITAEKFDEIKYDRVPSLAMKQYTSLFAKKDFEHFDQYIDNVAIGQAKISGATLLPSTLVSEVMLSPYAYKHPSANKGTDAVVQQKLKEIQMKRADGQWNTLFQRIRDSGTLEPSIAVCDVSGSMSGPRFADGTTPMDSSIGLSLLLAEITSPPFGGSFITFHQKPQVLQVGGQDDKRSFKEKVDYIARSDWGGNTDFVAVFEKLILPMAVENKLKQEDMVKQIFVFSDMQFDSAGGDNRWKSSYERIQKKFEEAGYEMPMLIFWNLAGGRAGYDGPDTRVPKSGDRTAPKPVTAAEEGTALVSGYSQGQMKMFLDNGGFEGPDEEEMVEEEEGDDGEVLVEKKKQKAAKDPVATVKKAISHEAYRMLKVVD